MRTRPAVALALAGLLGGVGSGAALSSVGYFETASNTRVQAAADDAGRSVDAASRSEARGSFFSAAINNASLRTSSLAGLIDENLMLTVPVASESVAEPAQTPEVVLPDGVDEAGFGAGLLSQTIAAGTSGALDVIPGEVAAPGAGTVRSVRVEVEQGLDIDGIKFADFVLATLNDSRGWGGDGSQTFARTTGPADIVVTLASPDTVDMLCAPLDTDGLYSCGTGNRAVLNQIRWIEGSTNYADMTTYRNYLVNHEVGHVLGKSHDVCGASTDLAPVMVQQSGGTIRCEPNAWPFP
jgi:Protein of unknown function (DUF3152)